MTRPLNAIIWLIAISSLLLGAAVTAAFVLMATSLDPLEALDAGAEPWTDALIAVAALGGLALSTLLGLKLWHSQRHRIWGAALLALQSALVIYACVEVYAEYF